MAAHTSTGRFDVVVIGGGQAGLAVGYHLAQRNLRFVILDAQERVGDAWRRRWDSLRLFTPARLNSLPGMPFPAPADSTVTKDQMADYLERYAGEFRLPIRLGTSVQALTQDDGRFVVRTDSDAFEARQVVVATGGHPTPIVPGFARELAPQVKQLHSSEYRNATQLQAGRVLVVGAGNSGAEIALEAAASHPTWLAGRCTGRLSPAVYARPAWWLLKQISDVRRPMGRRLKQRTLSMGTPLVRLRQKSLEAVGVIRVGRVVGVRDGHPQLQNGEVLEVENVVWCTGFSHDFGWIKLPAVVDGHLTECDRGVTSQPGLYFVGLPFQSNLASALVDGVGSDARYVSQRIGASIGVATTGDSSRAREMTASFDGGTRP